MAKAKEVQLETAAQEPTGGGFVRFRFNQHSFSPLGSGQMGEVKPVPVENVPELLAMGLGEVLPDLPKAE